MNGIPRNGLSNGMEPGRRRALGMFLFFMACFACLLLRLVILQIVSASELRERGERQGGVNVQLLPWRGTIYDRHMQELAISVSTVSVYMRPGLVRKPEEVIEALSSALGVGREESEKKLQSRSPFVWVRRKIERSEAEGLNMLPGLGMVEESRRFYPSGKLAGHVIGFAGMDNYGLEGLELLYDEQLGGSPGTLVSRMDARGRETVALRRKKIQPHEGYSLLLTIDKMMQYIVEEEINRSFTAAGEGTDSVVRVEGITVIVMDPRTGDILALANRPSYSPLSPGAYPPEARRNRAVTDVFEPGSSFKVVAAAGALEEGLFSKDDRIFCEGGAYRIAGHTIRDVSASDWLTFSEIIHKSSNIGMLKIGKELGDDRLYHYVRRFGFGEKTGSGLPGEAEGTIRRPAGWSRLSNASICFGYEVAVTSMQMAAAYSAIANGGLLVKPRLVSSVIDGRGGVVERFEPETRRRVISERTSGVLSEMLAGAVEEGTGRRAGVRGYRVAGKTGTAKKIDDDGTYSNRRYVSSFAGFAPVPNPEMVIVVVVDEPHAPPRQCYGGVMAAPLFSRIASRLLRYSGVPPSDTRVRLVEAASIFADESSAAGAGIEYPAGGDRREPEYIVASGDEEEFRVVMPDVRGLNMREVLRVLSPYGLEVRFSGSGVAVDQKPRPGEAIENGASCYVAFSAR